MHGLRADALGLGRGMRRGQRWHLERASCSADVRGRHSGLACFAAPKKKAEAKHKRTDHFPAWCCRLWLGHVQRPVLTPGVGLFHDYVRSS
eukprot:984205-Alexandrium_andersonii.AAC.1